MAAWLAVGVALMQPGCGARTNLAGVDLEDEADTTPVACHSGASVLCGSDVGACKKGTRRCGADGFFGECEGGVRRSPEICNGIDDDCNGSVDEGFGIGEACDGPDTDRCADDVMTCNGCSSGPSQAEVCNGVDDDCNGIIDADCSAGDCTPTLLVTGSVASSPNCVDFPVQASSTGRIKYPCEGGSVTAELSNVPFTGSVKNGELRLQGSEIVGPGKTPDGCTWKLDHAIQGSVSSGILTYSYAETLLSPPGMFCWSPCTETGTVKVQWVPGP